MYASKLVSAMMVVYSFLLLAMAFKLWKRFLLMRSNLLVYSFLNLAFGVKTKKSEVGEMAQ